MKGLGCASLGLTLKGDKHCTKCGEKAKRLFREILKQILAKKKSAFPPQKLSVVHIVLASCPSLCAAHFRKNTCLGKGGKEDGEDKED